MNEVTVTLPVWLPLANLSLGLVSLASLVFLTIRAFRRDEMRGQQTVVLTALVWAAVLVIVGGSLSQLGLISIEVWAIVGTGGRIVLTVGLLTIATLPRDDSIPPMPQSPNANRLDRLSDQIAENTSLTIEAAQRATEAYVTANNVNEKIADQGDALVAQGKVQALAAESAERIKTTVDHTAEQVEDIHDATVGK